MLAISGDERMIAKKMGPKMRTKLSFLAVSFLAVSFLVMASLTQAHVSDKKVISLRCALSNGVIKQYRVIPDANEIEHYSLRFSQTCRLNTTDQFYDWACDKTETMWQSVGRLDRYTGQFETEWGLPPFGKYSMDNLFFTGVCEQVDEEQKF